MYSETKPILFNCPKEQESIEIYPVHDLHYGNEITNDEVDAIMEVVKEEIAKRTNKDKKAGSLADVIVGADAFIGVSAICQARTCHRRRRA